MCISCGLLYFEVLYLGIMFRFWDVWDCRILGFWDFDISTWWSSRICVFVIVGPWNSNVLEFCDWRIFELWLWGVWGSVMISRFMCMFLRYCSVTYWFIFVMVIAGYFLSIRSVRSRYSVNLGFLDFYFLVVWDSEIESLGFLMFTSFAFSVLICGFWFGELEFGSWTWNNLQFLLVSKSQIGHFWADVWHHACLGC